MRGIAFLPADLAVFIGWLRVELFEERLFYELENRRNFEREAVSLLMRLNKRAKSAGEADDSTA